MNPSKISYGSLWMIKQFKDMYEIIHYKTDMVITTDGSEVRLDAGKAKSNQLFRTISVNRIVNDKPIMTIEDSNKNFLFLDGVLQCSN